MTTPNLDIDALERRLREPVPLDRAITKELLADAAAALRAEREKVAEAKNLLASATDEYETTYGKIINASEPHWSVAARALLNKTGDA